MQHSCDTLKRLAGDKEKSLLLPCKDAMAHTA